MFLVLLFHFDSQSFSKQPLYIACPRCPFSDHGVLIGPVCRVCRSLAQFLSPVNSPNRRLPPRHLSASFNCCWPRRRRVAAAHRGHYVLYHGRHRFRPIFLYVVRVLLDSGSLASCHRRQGEPDSSVRGWWREELGFCFFPVGSCMSSAKSAARSDQLLPKCQGRSSSSRSTTSRWL